MKDLCVMAEHAATLRAQQARSAQDRAQRGLVTTRAAANEARQALRTLVDRRAAVPGRDHHAKQDAERYARAELLQRQRALGLQTAEVERAADHARDIARKLQAASARRKALDHLLERSRRRIDRSAQAEEPEASASRGASALPNPSASGAGALWRPGHPGRSR